MVEKKNKKCKNSRFAKIKIFTFCEMRVIIILQLFENSRLKEVFALERAKNCADSHCEAECPYAIVREEYEPHQSMLGQYEGELFKVTSVRNEETVWKVYCNHSGQEKFVDYVWPYFGLSTPKMCPLLVQKNTQAKKKTFWEKAKEFFKK